MLLEDWKEVARKAWSFKLIIAAGVLSALEVGLALMPQDWMPAGVFAALSAVTALAACIARLMAQRSLPRG